MLLKSLELANKIEQVEHEHENPHSKGNGTLCLFNSFAKISPSIAFIVSLICGLISLWT